MMSLYKRLTYPALFILTLSMVLVSATFAVKASAAPASTCKIGNEPSCTQQTGKCGSNNGLGACTDPAAGASATCTAKSCDLIKKYINPLITLLSALVGVAVTISIIVGGIQYSSSNGNPQQITAAKTRIRDSVIALLAFFFLYTFLQFLVPGGVFRK
jgi:hypothetical protein